MPLILVQQELPTCGSFSLTLGKLEGCKVGVGTAFAYGNGTSPDTSSLAHCPAPALGSARWKQCWDSGELGLCASFFLAVSLGCRWASKEVLCWCLALSL